MLRPGHTTEIVVSGNDYELYKKRGVYFIDEDRKYNSHKPPNLIPLYPAWWVGETTSGKIFGGSSGKEVPMIELAYLNEISRNVHKKMGLRWVEWEDSPPCAVIDATSSSPQVEIFLERNNENSRNILFCELQRRHPSIVCRSCFPIEDLKRSFGNSFTLSFV